MKKSFIDTVSVLSDRDSPSVCFSRVYSDGTIKERTYHANLNVYTMLCQSVRKATKDGKGFVAPWAGSNKVQWCYYDGPNNLFV